MAALLQFRRLRRLQVIDFRPLFTQLDTYGLSSWAQVVPPLIAARLDPSTHGDLPRWYGALAALPAIPPAARDLRAECVTVAPSLDDPSERERLVELLQRFHPWRKGPFCIHGIRIDSEWRSDQKWNRLSHAVELDGKRVLDVGCGNGYYGWRMVGAGARLALGIDPTLLYVLQYAAMRRFLGETNNYVLPLRIEDLPPPVPAFDVVFSMGVLYHRRDPLEHLRTLRGYLKPGGQLVLETLVIEGALGEVLSPRGRYAKMKNVRAIPAVATAEQWLGQAGFCDIRCVDVTATSSQEQRSTPWMRFESLADFLDPADARKTCEGYPAPLRAVFTARG